MRASAEHKLVGIFSCPDAFAYDCETEHLGKVDHVFNDNAAAGIIERELAEVEFEIVCFQILEKIERRPSETELVDRDLDALFGKLLSGIGEKTSSAFEIRLGELDADKFPVNAVTVDYVDDVACKT